MFKVNVVHLFPFAKNVISDKIIRQYPIKYRIGFKVFFNDKLYPIITMQMPNAAIIE
ncbi:MAG: hypothetical protein NVSMB67_25110 [Flavisolibacter sp.]